MKNNKQLIYKDDARREVLKSKPSIVYCIDNIKPVDAVEVVHGRWLYEGLNAVCSNCGFEWFDGCQECGVCPSDVNYCPHCGAKIDLED